jgi:hypothetical protein
MINEKLHAYVYNDKLGIDKEVAFRDTGNGI